MKLSYVITVALFFNLQQVFGWASYVNIAGVTQFISYISDPNSYLSAADLAPDSTIALNQTYTAANLQDADLRNCQISGVGFLRVNFTNANFDGATFNSSTTHNLGQGIYEGVSAVGTDFGGASFWKSSIENADFRFSDFSNAIDVNDATWTNTKLYGAALGSWTEADFEGADFTTVPEPSTYALLFGIASLFAAARRRL